MFRVKVFSVIVVVMVVVVFYSQQSEGKLLRILQRQKRISDQRLAELETLIGLANMRAKLVTVPVGFGKVNPTTMGRRRRSDEQLIQQLIRDRSSQESKEDMENSIQEEEEEAEEAAEEEAEKYEQERLELLSRLLFKRDLQGNIFRHLPVRLPK